MSDRASASAGRIFINYRRQETGYPAGWLYDRLSDHFGEGQIFKDVDSIQPGDDFAAAVMAAVGSCDVLLALIGRQWLAVTDESGKRRLDNPDDFVRLEIETALARQVRIVPILVDGATMPHADDLPSSLRELVRRQAVELSPSRFEIDADRLLAVLQEGPSHPELSEAKGEAPSGIGPNERRDAHAGTTGPVNPGAAGAVLGNSLASTGPHRRWRKPQHLAVVSGVVAIGLVALAIGTARSNGTPRTTAPTTTASVTSAILDVAPVVGTGIAIAPDGCLQVSATDGTIAGAACRLASAAYPVVEARRYASVKDAAAAFSARPQQRDTDVCAPTFEGHYLVDGSKVAGSVRCLVGPVGTATRAVIEWLPEQSSSKFVLFGADREIAQILSTFQRAVAPVGSPVRLLSDEAFRLVQDLPAEVRGEYCHAWTGETFAGTIADVFCPLDALGTAQIRSVRFVSPADAKETFDQFASAPSAPDCWSLGTSRVSTTPYPTVELACDARTSQDQPYSAIYWWVPNTTEFGYVIHWQGLADDTDNLVRLMTAVLRIV